MKVCTRVSLVVLALLAVPALADDIPLRQEGRWAQDYTGRKADPAVLFGTLPNGLRYAIMRNTTPSDGVAMQMRIGAGSIEERDEEQGLAHFLEHMAFRGSANVADGEVVRMLERQGLRFGPDTNAFTMQQQTVYQFNFPHGDQSALDTGMTLFREIGERLTLTSAAVEAEKGVVLSEERLRDVPQYRAVKANLGNSLAGTRAARRWPIGTVETIKIATPERLRRFYQANYRPDNATLVIVGNIDPAKVEAQVKARFSDWKAAGKPDSIDPGTPAPVQQANEYSATGAPDNLVLGWVRPADRRAETEAYDREQLTRLVALTVLNNRIADRAAKPGSPLVGGGAYAVSNLMDTAAITQIGIAAAADKWSEALAVVVEEQRQAANGPISPDEVRRAVMQIHTQLETAVQNASTRQNDALAGDLVKAADEDQLFTSPAQDLAFAGPILTAIGSDDVSAALRGAFAGKGPILFRSTQAAAVGADALTAQLAADYSRPLAARTAEEATAWPYTDFGAPARITAQRSDKALGTTLVTFANGSRLLIKPTQFEKGKIHVNVALGEGRAGADPALVRALWASELFPLGGTGKASVTDIQRWAQSGGKVVFARLETGNRAFNLGGTTRPADFLSQMQLLAAYARDPGFRPELGDKIGAIGPMIAGQVEANAGAVFMLESQRVLSGGTSRFDPLPTKAEIAATKADDLPALLRGALAGPANVTIVGDTDVASAIKAMQSTFAAGGKSAPPPRAKVQVTMPAGGGAPIVVTHNGRADQAFYGEYWNLPDYYADPQLSYVADVAAAILQARMIDTVREKLGMTYSPQASALSSSDLPGQGYLGVTIETPPANFDTFHTLMAAQLVELAAKPVSADELTRARQPLIDSHAKQLESNDWWTANLATMLRDPRARPLLLEQVASTHAVTAEQVRAFFARYAGPSKATVIIARPK